MPTMRLITVIVLALTSTAAWADDDGTAELEKTLVHPAPGPGLEKARTGAPSWCASAKAGPSDWAFDVATGIQNYRQFDHDRHHDTGGESSLLHAAALVCGANHPAAQHAATEIEQLWINETGLAEADAVTSLAARIDKAKIEAARDKLCGEMPEAEGNVDDKGNKREKRILAFAHRQLMGCGNSDPLWIQKQSIDYIQAYVDRGSVERDPLARLAWLLNEQFGLLDVDDTPDRTLIAYAVDQFDLHAQFADAVLRELDAAPYHGDRYARLILLESLARLKLRSAQIEIAVAKVTRDPSWKEMLVTVPQRGYAAWLAAADKQKDVLARSDAFDRKTRESGDIHGCEAPLRADFLAILKKHKHDDVETLRAELSDDLMAGLVLQRLVTCMMDDGNAGVGEVVGRLSDAIRLVSGPRSAAYFATVDALAAQKRGQRPFDPGRIPRFDDDSRRDREDSLNFAALDMIAIAGADKKADGVHVTFVQNKSRVMSQECADSNKIDRILPDGKVQYRRVCHDAGMITVDQTPWPRTVPTSVAGGVRGGRVGVFTSIDQGGGRFEDGAEERHGHKRRKEPETDAKIEMPLVIYSDKTLKHLVAFFGFSLE
jgi:hypothetical protein